MNQDAGDFSVGIEQWFVYQVENFFCRFTRRFIKNHADFLADKTAPALVNRIQAGEKYLPIKLRQHFRNFAAENIPLADHVQIALVYFFMDMLGAVENRHKRWRMFEKTDKPVVLGMQYIQQLLRLILGEFTFADINENIDGANDISFAVEDRIYIDRNINAAAIRALHHDFGVANDGALAQHVSHGDFSKWNEGAIDTINTVGAAKFFRVFAKRWCAPPKFSSLAVEMHDFA
ncbi:MAG: hypothetical protein NVV73_08265 [Cellvibrionaceae bacterium]|nr:hypothetical protein [Cellvibrionaceae bacterium]